MADKKNARKKKTGKKRTAKRFIFLFVEIIILAALSVVAYAMFKYDKFQKVSLDETDIQINEGVEKEGYTTIALFGGDSRDGVLEEGTHADCIIVASIDNQTKEIRMSSIYRDTYLKQRDGDYKKANNAYFVGGPKDAVNMLNENLDLAIQDYATVDFKALSDAVDLLGGIEIEITEEEIGEINSFIDETAMVAEKEAIHLTEPGIQTLDGVQATTYARIRSTAGGDYKRAERQRTVIEKILEKVKTTNVVQLNSMIDVILPQVSTSFGLTELVALAADVTQYSLGETAGFPYELAGDTFPACGFVNVPLGHAENVQELHAFLYPKESYGPSETVLTIADEIVNNTGYTRSDAGTIE